MELIGATAVSLHVAMPDPVVTGVDRIPVCLDRVEGGGDVCGSCVRGASTRREVWAGLFDERQCGERMSVRFVSVWVRIRSGSSGVGHVGSCGSVQEQSRGRRVAVVGGSIAIGRVVVVGWPKVLDRVCPVVFVSC